MEAGLRAGAKATEWPPDPKAGAPPADPTTQTAALLKEFETRRFDQHTFAVLLLDGKYLAGMQMIVAMGITTEGEKVVLGFAESRTENSAQVESLLQEGLHIFKLGIGKLLWRWTLASTIPFQPYEPLTACFGEV